MTHRDLLVPVQVKLNILQQMCDFQVLLDQPEEELRGGPRVVDGQKVRLSVAGKVITALEKQRQPDVHKTPVAKHSIVQEQPIAHKKRGVGKKGGLSGRLGASPRSLKSPVARSGRRS